MSIQTNIAEIRSRIAAACAESGREAGEITLVGAIFLGIIAVFPIVFSAITGANVSLGGTSILIIVGVALETMRQMESQMMMRHHKGFLE